MPVKPLLIVAWGNRSRGDDALGPRLLDALGRALTHEQAQHVDLLEEHQLHPELALDLVGRQRVLLIDADPQAASPFALQAVVAGPDASLSSHAISPQALLAVFEELHGRHAPPVTLMGVHAAQFGLGRPLSPEAEAVLPATLLWVLGWIDGARGDPPDPAAAGLSG